MPAVEYLQAEIDDTLMLRVPVKNRAVLIALPHLDNGIHSIRLTAEQRRRPNDRETSFRKLSRGFRLIVEGSKWNFAASAVYEANKSLFPTNSKPSDYLNPDKDIHSKHAAIVNLARRITRNCRNDYEMARAIHDWVARNIYYDYDALASSPNNYPKGAMDVLMSGKTLCGGFANLTAALLRSIGIPCRAVAGYSASNGIWTDENINADPNHAWNEAYVAERWLIMDVAWDCEMSFRNSLYERGAGLRDRRYFDPSLESFSIDHRIYDADLNAIQY
jgi:transglutaminase-like putative cysteine protease